MATYTYDPKTGKLTDKETGQTSSANKDLNKSIKELKSEDKDSNNKKSKSNKKSNPETPKEKAIAEEQERQSKQSKKGVLVLDKNGKVLSSSKDFQDTYGDLEGKRVSIEQAKRMTAYSGGEITASEYKQDKANKSASHNKANYGTSRPNIEKIAEQRKAIDEKIKKGEALTDKEQYFLITGEGKANVESANRYMSKVQDHKAESEKIKQIYDYNSEVKKNKETQEPKQTPAPLQNKGYSSKTARFVGDYAEAVIKKEKDVAEHNKARADFWESKGLHVNNLQQEESDSWGRKFFKSLGQGGYALTFGLVDGSTFEGLVHTTNKAGLWATSGVASLWDKDTRSGFQYASKEAAVETVTTRLNPLNPEGAATYFMASGLAGLKTGAKLSRMRNTGGAPETTGKISNLKIEGSIKSKGAVQGGTPKTTPTSSSNIKVSYLEKTKGLIKRNIETTVEQSKSGTTVKTQTLGKTTYRTTNIKGSANAIVEKIVNGKSVQTATIKNPFSDSSFQQFEAALKTKQEASFNQNKNLLAQETEQTSVSRVYGRISKNQVADGNVEVKTTAKSVTAAKDGVQIKSSKAQITKNGKTETVFFKEEVSPIKPNLKVSNKPTNPKPNIETTNTPQGVTTKQNPQTYTSFEVETNYKGNLAVKNGANGYTIETPKLSLLKSKRAASSSVQVEYIQDVEIAKLNIGNSNIKIQIPTTDSALSSPTLSPAFIITQSSEEKEKINNKPEIKPENKVVPTIISKPDITTQPKRAAVIDSDIKPENKTKNIFKSANRSKPDLTEKIKQKEKEKIEINQTSKEKQIFRKQVLFQPSINPSLKPQEQPPEIVFSSSPLMIPSQKTRRKEGFNVLSRMFGREVIINNKPLTEKEANFFGAAHVDRSARASYKVVKSGKSATGKFLGRANMQDFRKNKKGWTIEKRSARINSPGEKREITNKGRRSKKKKSKLRGYFNGND